MARLLRFWLSLVAFDGNGCSHRSVNGTPESKSFSLGPERIPVGNLYENNKKIIITYNIIRISPLGIRDSRLKDKRVGAKLIILVTVYERLCLCIMLSNLYNTPLQHSQCCCCQNYTNTIKETIIYSCGRVRSL